MRTMSERHFLKVSSLPQYDDSFKTAQIEVLDELLRSDIKGIQLQPLLKAHSQNFEEDVAKIKEKFTSETFVLFDSVIEDHGILKVSQAHVDKSDENSSKIIPFSLNSDLTVKYFRAEQKINALKSLQMKQTLTFVLKVLKKYIELTSQNPTETHYMRIHLNSLKEMQERSAIEIASLRKETLSLISQRDLAEQEKICAMKSERIMRDKSQWQRKSSKIGNQNQLIEMLTDNIASLKNHNKDQDQELIKYMAEMSKQKIIYQRLLKKDKEEAEMTAVNKFQTLYNSEKQTIFGLLHQEIQRLTAALQKTEELYDRESVYLRREIDDLKNEKNLKETRLSLLAEEKDILEIQIMLLRMENQARSNPNDIYNPSLILQSYTESPDSLFIA